VSFESAEPAFHVLSATSWSSYARLTQAMTSPTYALTLAERQNEAGHAPAKDNSHAPDSNPRPALVRSEKILVRAVLRDALAVVVDGCELAAEHGAPDVRARVRVLVDLPAHSA
jgi:hypothetical protein